MLINDSMARQEADQCERARAQDPTGWAIGRQDSRPQCFAKDASNLCPKGAFVIPTIAVSIDGAC